MSWYDPRSWLGGRTSVMESGGAHAAHGGPVDLSDFERGEWLVSNLSPTQVISLASYGMGCRPETKPQHVPLAVLDAMGWDPVINCGESIVTGPACDRALYYTTTDGSARAKSAERWVEAWLWPLLTQHRNPLLPMIAKHAFGVGFSVVVLDYDEDRGGHAVYARPHELWPGHVSLDVQDDMLLGVRAGSRSYGGEDHPNPGQARAYLSVWDPTPDKDGLGQWRGRGARRRAYQAWIRGEMTDLWLSRYLERSVDLPRVGYAPDGPMTINGVARSSLSVLRTQILSLKNGSVAALPGALDEKGNRLWKIETLDVPDRSDVFQTAVTSYGVRKLWACLIPSGMADKASEEQVMDMVQGVCDHTAMTLSRIARNALRVRYGERPPVVNVVANVVPKRKQRIVLEVFRAVAGTVQHMTGEDGEAKTYTLGELVHPDLIEDLGVRMRPVEEAAHEPGAGGQAPGQPGRPLDTASGREERRDDADTIEGEEDTGGEDMDREGRL